MVDGASSRTETSLPPNTVLTSIGNYFEDDTVRRVYEQRQNYHHRPIDGTLFSRYCMLNDSNWDVSQAAAFRVYYKQLLATNKLPELCVERRRLIDSLLTDLKATHWLQRQWDTRWTLPPADGVHLAFISTMSGLMRYADGKLPNVAYEDPFWDEPAENATFVEPKGTYKHFSVRYARGPEEPFFRRAFLFGRQGESSGSANPEDPIFYFNTTTTTRAYYTSEVTSSYGHSETFTPLVTGFTPIYSPTANSEGERAAVGVAGFEMLYDSLAGMAQQLAPLCAKRGEWPTVKCYLLDESGYVVYSSADMSYENETNPHIAPGAATLAAAFSMKTPRFPLARFYADVSAVEHGIMFQLARNKIYTEKRYVDYQALCSDRKETAGAPRLLSPLLAVAKFFLWFFHKLIVLAGEYGHYSMWSLVYGLFQPSAAFTRTFTATDQGMPCDKTAAFFILNRATKPSQVLSKPCGDMDCTAWAYAAPVPRTNLLLVVQRTDGQQCGMHLQCLQQSKEKVDYKFQTAMNASDKMVSGAESGSGADQSPLCKSSEARHHRQPNKCWNQYHDEKEYKCQRGSHRVSPLSGLGALCALGAVLYLHRPHFIAVFR